MSDTADADLVAEARNGRESAYEELYRRHVSAVRLAVSDNVDDAATRDDLVQEAFIRALAALDQLKEPQKFRAWLLQIARHAAIDNRRRRRALVVDSIDEENTPPLPSPDAGPVELAELHELAGRVRSGLARMSPRDATVLSLSTHLGFGPREIADALGITDNNAKVVLHRARRRLRLALELEPTGDETRGDPGYTGDETSGEPDDTGDRTSGEPDDTGDRTSGEPDDTGDETSGEPVDTGDETSGEPGDVDGHVADETHTGGAKPDLEQAI